MNSTRAPIEAKTQAAGLAGIVAGAVIYLLQTYAFKGSTVPAGVVSLIYAAVPGILAFAAAWLAPHTPRPAVTQLPPARIAVLPPPTGPATDPPPPTGNQI